MLDLSSVLLLTRFSKPAMSADRALHHFRRVVRRHVIHGRSAGLDHLQHSILDLAKTGVLRILFPRCTNIFNLRYLDFIYLQLATIVTEASLPMPLLDIKWQNEKSFEDMCHSQNSFIILVLHSGFSHTARAVSYSERRIAHVAGVPERMSDFLQMNRVRNASDIEIVPVDKFTLLTLAEVMGRNKAIICAPDQIDPATGRCDLLNLAMFKFAQKFEVPVYFVDYVLNENASLCGFIKGPLTVKSDPKETAQEFVEFCMAVSGRRLSME